MVDYSLSMGPVRVWVVSMSEHMHEWRWHSMYLEDGIDCRLCAEDDSIDYQEAWMDNDEVIRRLNATERLSKTSAMAAATTSLRGGDVVSYEDLLAYAAALEGEDG